MSILVDHSVSIGCILLLLIAFSMNYFFSDASSLLGLVTVNTIIADYQVWNLITSQFYEQQLIKLVFDVVGIVVITRSTKIRVGKHFILYFVLSILTCSVFTSAYCFIRYFSTGIEEMILQPIFGFSGVFMVVLTFSRQQLRDLPVIPQIPSITYNNLPILVIIAQMLLWLIGFRIFAVDLPFSIVAILFSWSYLRFFYNFEYEKVPRFDDDGNILSPECSFGDSSAEFAFVSMFPEVLYMCVHMFVLSVFTDLSFLF